MVLNCTTALYCSAGLIARDQSRTKAAGRQSSLYASLNHLAFKVGIQQAARCLLIRRVAVIGLKRGLSHLAQAAMNPAQMNRYRGQSRKIKPRWRLVEFPLVSVCVCVGGRIEKVHS